MDYTPFKGTFPYAAVNFGVFQPLFGWKGQTAKSRVAQVTSVAAARLVDQMMLDSRFSDALATGTPAGGPVTDLAPRRAPWLGNAAVGTQLQLQTDASIKKSPSAALRDYVVQGLVSYLGQTAPAVLDQLVAITPAWQRASPYVDLASAFPPSMLDAVMSPIGVLNVFREYFFELESFLGVPVGHVWISPGGSVEVFEVHTRRTLQEQTVTQSTETMTSDQRSTVDQDDLAASASQQNVTNTKFAVSASAGGSIGVVHASGTTSYGTDTTQTTAQTSAHNTARQQSQTLSQQIRQNYQTEFRTTVEQTDTSSRRYVIQNPSSELANYELRRKMRRVVVQLQHVGTQLCWQLFIDQPGSTLGVAELVHLAQPTDAATGALQPPAAPEIFPKYPKPFEYWMNYDNTQRTQFTPPQPAPQYVIDHVELASDPGTYPNLVLARLNDTTFNVTNLNDDQSHYHEWGFIPVNVYWRPPDQTAELAAYTKQLAAYTAQQSQQTKQDFVDAVRERVKLASAVSARPADDLRGEERSAVMRRLIETLLGGPDIQVTHLTAEILRSTFDLDGVLYFVSPDWWRPTAMRYYGEPGVDAWHPLPAGATTGWGGIDDAGRFSYYITEDSQPARAGASIGWLLQLDGDSRRNAFLNSPWVKVVVPILPGHESDAITWLQQAHVEGSDGLAAKYGGPEPALAGLTVQAALARLASDITSINDPVRAMATETVFQDGFDPLADGVRATGVPYEIFDQWLEVLPTDQVVASNYVTP